MRSFAIAAALVPLLAAPAARADQPARTLTLAEAVAMAGQANDGVLINAEAVHAAEHHLAADRALRWPKLHGDANLTLWDKELAFTLPGPNGTTMDAVFRERLTGSASLQLIQPISPLLVIQQMIKLDQAGIAAARADLDKSRADAGYLVAEAYLRLLQASAMREVAARSVAQLEAHLARARVLEKGGVAQNHDVLRLEAARDAAQQALLSAEAGIYTGERGIALALGLPDDQRIAVKDDLPETPPPPPIDEEGAARGALAMRPEQRAARAHIEQAVRGRNIARANYFPNISAIGQVQRNQGVSTLQPENSWFVGVNLTWDIWDWGKTRHTVAEAQSRRVQAEIAAQAGSRQIAFDARRRAREAALAYQSLAAAQSAVRAAEEAYRIRGIALGQGEATTTDVLDAENEVARARVQAVVARYDYYLALTALARATGGTPVPM
ncbi:MAG TPA: TolC family protein [Kofleriaceae bacterium]|nr:TolC family protein [Kofleriaceae bacterium]